MVPTDSPVRDSLDRLPGFELVEEPSERYDVYEVDLQRLDELVGEAGPGAPPL